MSRGAVHRALVARNRDQYDARLEAQGGGCAICGAAPKTRRLHMDHDHKTLQLRGLLCFRCNRALPDYVDAAWLRKAAEYLEAAA